MATQLKPPKRLQIRDHCKIAGLIEGKVLVPGVYERGENIPEDVFDKLLTDEFSHAVTEYKERRVELATPSDAPKEAPGDTFRRQRREAEELRRKERWGDGRPTQYTIPD